MIPLVDAGAAGAAGAAGLAFGVIFAIIFAVILLIALGVFLFVLWIWMLVDCVKRNLDDTEKVVWILLMVFLGGIASIVYYFVVYRKHNKKRKT